MTDTDNEFNPITKPPPVSHVVTIAHRCDIRDKFSVAGFTGSGGRCGVESYSYGYCRSTCKSTTRQLYNS